MTRRVLLSAEGQTEETFVRDILAPRLLAIDVEVKPVILAIQLHEFEALVYAAPDIAAERSGDLTVATMMRKAVARAGGAELVNERPTTAP